MEQPTPQLKLANLRWAYEHWDDKDVSVRDFVELYKEVANKLFQEVVEIDVRGEYL